MSDGPKIVTGPAGTFVDAFASFLAEEINRRGMTPRAWALSEPRMSVSAVAEWLRREKPIHIESVAKVAAKLKMPLPDLLRAMAQHVERRERARSLEAELVGVADRVPGRRIAFIRRDVNATSERDDERPAPRKL